MKFNVLFLILSATFLVNTYLRFHHNWGWANSYDGWFGFSNFTVNGSTYNSSMRMIYHIYP
jgi:hypothetical protein